MTKTLHVLDLCSDAGRRSTWFTQDDVNQMVSAGINTVRIPVSVIGSQPATITPLTPSRQLGYWIVEPLVDRTVEFYPRGGIKQLVSFRKTFLVYVVDAINLQTAKRLEPTQVRWNTSYSRSSRTSRCAGRRTAIHRKVTTPPAYSFGDLLMLATQVHK